MAPLACQQKVKVASLIDIVIRLIASLPYILSLRLLPSQQRYHYHPCRRDGAPGGCCRERRRLDPHPVTFYILSGDQEEPTRRLAEHLGIAHYQANTRPEQKASFIETVQARGCPVCFVGDGINDGIALKKAHVSISLRGTTTVATDTAQTVSLRNHSCFLCKNVI